MRVNIEAIIELKATVAGAESLAERVRREEGLKVSVSNTHPKIGGNNGYRGKGEKPVKEELADWRLLVTGQTSGYQGAEKVAESLRGMLKHSGDNGSNPILAIFSVYDQEGNVI